MVEQLKAERAKLRAENAKLTEELRRLAQHEARTPSRQTHHSQNGSDAASVLAQLSEERQAWATREEGLKSELEKARLVAEERDSAITVRV